MAENLKKNPRKSILKSSISFDREEKERGLQKGAKWDEMNILATHHPEGKDYGHMKINEPKTPFYNRSDSGDEGDIIDANFLSDRIRHGENDLPKALLNNDENEDSDFDENETPEEREKRKEFELKRKHHYNEFAAVQLARKLMEQEEDDDTNEEDNDENKEESEKTNLSSGEGDGNIEMEDKSR